MDVRVVIPNPVLLHSTGAVAVTAGNVGGAGGATGDSLLVSVVILATAVTATTLTVAGFKGEDGTARNVLLTGAVSVDTVYNFGAGLRNTGAAMTLTASAADKVLVGVQEA